MTSDSTSDDERELSQGPKAGRHWTPELEEYVDPGTGARVRQLTTQPGAQDHHLYFTTGGWYDDGRRLLLRSVREGEWDLFSIDLETGQLTQLTDLPQDVSGSTRVNERTGEVYFAYSFEGEAYDNDVIVGLDLHTLAVRPVVEKPEGYDDYNFGVDDVLADDERLLVSVGERTDGEGHAGIHETYPQSAIFTAEIEGDDDLELVHGEEYWISHVNASPTRPELLTYCHEGPWDYVDNRIHVANLETGETYRLRETDEETAVGHEYWLADGEYVGYHGWRGERTPEDSFHGTVRYDDTDRLETKIPVRRTHCHSNTRERFVCDGDDTKAQYLLLYERDEDGEYRQPRKLASHAWGEDSPHPHSRFSPDGSTVVFGADRAGPDNDVFLVDVPDDVTTLPLYHDPNAE
ncbi:oligogalacturonate lyase family protein [Halomontanus rarus]|uniref:oligogalacturonate lyase family protein n=1 Tax=Halomontanus rarus TaxID=3034020 RepID=UPI0023E7815D|nr:oligogalacturonate lyase family protein [Halovivax sp. TS33]